ncbi:hypothetical protein [Streptomyces sp. WMMB303]|uniref:hypothetical protein n=1 Tax=Streptomyces sp. WMMB303 TaxID=3034154 RepID=UPI0023ED00B8|nr:hypothetical protein [Streptomyces sp. WMMB303]MDF4254630.1 hypothetical protein [Streptomyces sp. WMMB303]
MRQEFEPPHYTWSASTAEEAKTTLRAAADLIDAHLATLVPGDRLQRHQAKASTPLTLTVSMDLSGLIEKINTQRTIDGLEASLGDSA